METLKPGCPRNVESGETYLSWLYPQSIGWFEDRDEKGDDATKLINYRGDFRNATATLALLITNKMPNKQ